MTQIEFTHEEILILLVALETELKRMKLLSKTNPGLQKYIEDKRQLLNKVRCVYISL